jgi:hypothetical protein
MLTIPAHRCMHTVATWRQTQCGLSARSCGFWLLSWGFTVLVEAHGHHGYASSSLLATGAGATSHVKAPARLVAQHQNPAQRRTVLALLRYTHLPYSVASDSKLLDTSRSLGTVVPPRRAIAASSAREGEKVWNGVQFLLRKS